MYGQITDHSIVLTRNPIVLTNVFHVMARKRNNGTISSLDLVLNSFGREWYDDK